MIGRSAIVRAVWMAAAVVASTAEGADWNLVQDRESSVVEIDMASIAPIAPFDNLKRARVRERFSSVQKGANDRAFDTSEMVMQIKCAENEAAVQEVNYYLQGKLIKQVVVQPKDLDFQQGSHVFESLFWRLACPAIH